MTIPTRPPAPPPAHKGAATVDRFAALSGLADDTALVERVARAICDAAYHANLETVWDHMDPQLQGDYRRLAAAAIAAMKGGDLCVEHEDCHQAHAAVRRIEACIAERDQDVRSASPGAAAERVIARGEYTVRVADLRRALGGDR